MMQQTQQGETNKGLQMIQDSMALYDATGVRAYRAYPMSQLAEALAWSGKLSEGFECADAALRHAEQTGDAYFMPELLRLKAQLGLEAGQTDRAGAERWFAQALALARSQGAGLLEQRAAESLVQLSGARS